MKSSIAIAVMLTGLLGWPTLVMAQDTRTGLVDNHVDPLSSDPTDPGNLLREIQKRDAQWVALRGLRTRDFRGRKKKK